LVSSCRQTHLEDRDEGHGTVPSRGCSRAQPQHSPGDPLRSALARLLQRIRASRKATPREEVERFIAGKREARPETYPVFWLSKGRYT